jgi:hypothetical protein
VTKLLINWTNTCEHGCGQKVLYKKTFWVQTIQFWVELLKLTILNRYFFIQNSSRAFEKATEGKKFYGHYVGHCFTILMALLPIVLNKQN